MQAAFLTDNLIECFSLLQFMTEPPASPQSSLPHLNFLNVYHHISNMMNCSNTESWLSINTSFSTLPLTARQSNRSDMGAYLERLAHLDEGLYNDFYGLWIALMVINSVIFLVGGLNKTSS